MVEYWGKQLPHIGGVSWPLRELSKSLAANNIWGIISDGSVASFVVYRSEGQAVEVDYLATNPKFEGKGYMSCVFSYLGSLSIQHSIPIWLEVSENNESAIALYEKFGFIRGGIRKNYYKNGQSALNYSYNP